MVATTPDLNARRAEVVPVAGDARGGDSRSRAGEHDTLPASLLRFGDQGTALAKGVRPWLVPGAEELFRGIYTRTATGGSEVIAVCSAIAGEGKTTVSLGIASTLAQDFPERRVVVVETDLERPVLAKDFDLDPSPGLSDCLSQHAPLDAACRVSSLENLYLLPAGGPTTHPGRVVRSSAMAVLVDALRRRYDVVILDVPAMLGNSDALLLSDLADGVVFVVRAGVTPTTLANKAIEQLDEGRLRGVVLNEVHSSIPGWLRRLIGL